MLLRHGKKGNIINGKGSLIDEYMKRKILVLDNDQDTVDIFCYLLDGIGYEVIGSTKTDILNSIGAIKVDLILMDTWLEGNSSGELCKRLKSDPAKQNIPVLLTSTQTCLPQITTESLADGYIEKPFDLDRVSQIINATLKSNS